MLKLIVNDNNYSFEYSRLPTAVAETASPLAVWRKLPGAGRLHALDSHKRQRRQWRHSRSGGAARTLACIYSRTSAPAHSRNVRSTREYWRQQQQQ